MWPRLSKKCCGGPITHTNPFLITKTQGDAHFLHKFNDFQVKFQNQLESLLKKLLLKEASFFRREKTTLDQIGWGPLYASYDHESMCVRKLIT